MKLSLSGTERVILMYPEDDRHYPGQYVASTVQGYAYATKKILEATNFETAEGARVSMRNVVRPDLKIYKLFIMVEIEEVD